jgi:hypothetical protein
LIDSLCYMIIDAATQDSIDLVLTASAGLPGFVALTLGGSAATGLADALSDVDLHVYWRAPLAAPAERAARLEQIADAGSVEVEIMTWGREDHLRVAGRLVELVYVPLDELLDEAAHAYGAGLFSEGFSTARLFYVANGQILHDTSGELGALQTRLLAEYPEPTRQQLLRQLPALLEAYVGQLRKAQGRGDLPFAVHRRASIQMVFFNLLFALNRRYHPGEKRLLIHGDRCPRRPADMAARWSYIARLPADDPKLLSALESLIAALCSLIEANP